MKVFHLSTFSFEGGAAKAAARLHKKLISIGIDSKFYAFRITNNFEHLYASKAFIGINFFKKFYPYIDSVLLKLLWKKANTPWTIGLFGSQLNEINKVPSNFIVHAHWIGAGFLSLNSLKKFKTKLVFTLHDSWLFTAGCHLPYDCDKFKRKCVNCPQLGNQANWLVKYLFNRKKEFFEVMKPIVVCPSKWMFDQAKESALLSECEIRYIPNSVDTSTFKPRIDDFKKNTDSFTIGFSALHALVDSNKGFNIFLKALEFIKEYTDIKNIIIEVIGAEKDHLNDVTLPFPVKFYGVIDSDSELAAIYSGADIFCVASKTESFCQVAAESIASGTPIVCFDTSGLKDLVIDGRTGYLAKPFDYKDLAFKIIQAYDNQDQLLAMSIFSRKYALENFDSNLVAKKMISLYNEIVL